MPWIYLGSQYIPLGPDYHSAAEGWRWRGGGLRLFKAASIARVMPRRARSAEGQGPGHSLYRRPARMGRATPLALLGCRGRWNVPRSRCLSEKKRERFTRRGKSLPSRIWGSILKTRSEESPAAWGPGASAHRPLPGRWPPPPAGRPVLVPALRAPWVCGDRRGLPETRPPEPQSRRQCHSRRQSDRAEFKADEEPRAAGSWATVRGARGPNGGGGRGRPFPLRAWGASEGRHSRITETASWLERPPGHLRRCGLRVAGNPRRWRVSA